jgi:hypothetical protein
MANSNTKQFENAYNINLEQRLDDRLYFRLRYRLSSRINNV